MRSKANDEGGGDAPGTMCVWPCPDAPHLPKESCYIFIQDQRGVEQAAIISVPDFVIEYAKILHVRDGLSITVLPSAPEWGSEWYAVEWCRIERCPKLDCVFARGNEVTYEYELRIFWASQLPKASCIWKLCKQMNARRAFSKLASLHLDCCPRLKYVLPVSFAMVYDPHMCGFLCLETIEIMLCGDLTEVFPLEIFAKRELELWKLKTLEFPKLKGIHLHELPKLHGICDPEWRISAPELETVKIRGCWSLKRLPIIEKEVQCDCGKEWWDSLEWDDASQKKLYRPIHSKYYKKSKLLRGTMLR